MGLDDQAEKLRQADEWLRTEAKLDIIQSLIEAEITAHREKTRIDGLDWEFYRDDLAAGIVNELEAHGHLKLESD